MVATSSDVFLTAQLLYLTKDNPEAYKAWLDGSRQTMCTNGQVIRRPVREPRDPLKSAFA